MNTYTREEILKITEEEDIEFIRLQFTDLFGNLKNIAITARELPRALDNKYIVDSSYIAGLSTETEPDMCLIPDLKTFAILPWRPQQSRVARLLCDIHRPDGTPLKRSSRYILKDIANQVKQEGYTCLINPECEFFLFHTDDNGLPTTVSHERAGYLDISPLDLGENARRDMVLNLEELGIDVVSSHHETAPAQHEIDIKEREMTEMADCIVTLKMAVKTLALRHGLHATFMPKPCIDKNGSGMHIKFSLFNGAKNVFYDPEAPDKLSKEAMYFIGGLLEHSREMALITNPVVNSYKRLVDGYEAPSELTWTKYNHNSLVRIPAQRGLQTSIELRSPDGASNPYLVFAVCLAAGLDGIKKKILPTEGSDLSEIHFTGNAMKNIELDWEKRNNEKRLPVNMKEAIDLFEKSEWIKEVVGTAYFEEYLTAKKKEWMKYTQQITQWELDEYLYRI